MIFLPPFFAPPRLGEEHSGRRSWTADWGTLCEPAAARDHSRDKPSTETCPYHAPWLLPSPCATIGQGEQNDESDHRTAGRPGAQPSGNCGSAAQEPPTTGLGTAEFTRRCQPCSAGGISGGGSAGYAGTAPSESCGCRRARCGDSGWPASHPDA